MNRIFARLVTGAFCLAATHPFAKDELDDTHGDAAFADYLLLVG
jgi:hypothetical protein